MRYRKKPVVIEAHQFEINNAPDDAHMDGLVAWIREGGGTARHDSTCIYIETLEGTHRADVGDWIIRGVKGEFYPCKPDIFEMTYEAASVAPPSDHAAALEAAWEALEKAERILGNGEGLDRGCDTYPDRVGASLTVLRAALARIAQESKP